MTNVRVAVSSQKYQIDTVLCRLNLTNNNSLKQFGLFTAGQHSVLLPEEKRMPLPYLLLFRVINLLLGSVYGNFRLEISCFSTRLIFLLIVTTCR